MVPLLALGGKGVISVVSNVAPELVHNCCQAFFDGDTAKARDLQLEMLPLSDALFCEVNPIPVKYAMNLLGWEAGECRLPLVSPVSTSGTDREHPARSRSDPGISFRKNAQGDGSPGIFRIIA